MSSLSRSESFSKTTARDLSTVAVTTRGDVARLAGKLRKKSNNRNAWNERFFVLRGPYLEYFTSQADLEPKGRFALAGCNVGGAKEVKSSGRMLYSFRLTWGDAEDCNAPCSAESPRMMVPSPSSPSSHLRRRGLPASSTGGVQNETLGKLVDEENQRRLLLGRSGIVPEDEGKTLKRSNNEKMKIGLKVGAAATAGVAVGVLTMGVGLVAGMVVLGVGAATTGAGTVGLMSKKKLQKKGLPLCLAADSEQEAELWRSAIVEQISFIEATTGQYMRGGPLLQPKSKQAMNSQATSTPPPALPAINLLVADSHVHQTDWMCHTTVDGVRIFREENSRAVQLAGTKDFYAGQNSTLLKCCVRVGASPLDILMAILSSPNETLNGIINGIEVVETVDDHTDVIRLQTRPSVLGGLLCASARDFCLARYWCRQSSGSYLIHLASVDHPLCPPRKGYIRGLMRSTYTIAARANTHSDMQTEECLLSHFCQTSPMGFLKGNIFSAFLYTSQVLLSVIDVRDTVEFGNFNHVSMDFAPTPSPLVRLDPSTRASLHMGDSGMRTDTPLTMPQYADTFVDIGNIHAFQARAKNYTTDRKKEHAGVPIGELVRCDFFTNAASRVDHISSKGRYGEMIDKLTRPGRTLFVVNYQAPFSPFLSMVIVWSVPHESSHPELDRLWAKFINLPKDISPDGKLPADDLRTRRFKLFCLIPQGPWIVRKVVGTTPVLLAQKLTCRYFSRPGVFELCIDIASSTIANNTCSLAQSHAKVIVVDMAVSIQGEAEDELPERLLGTVRLTHPDLGRAKPFDDFQLEEAKQDEEMSLLPAPADHFPQNSPVSAGGKWTSRITSRSPRWMESRKAESALR